MLQWIGYDADEFQKINILFDVVGWIKDGHTWTLIPRLGLYDLFKYILYYLPTISVKRYEMFATFKDWNTKIGMHVDAPRTLTLCATTGI